MDFSIRKLIGIGALGIMALPAFSQTAAWVAARPGTNHNAILKSLCGTATCRNSVVRIDRTGWEAALAAAPKEGTGNGARIQFPMPDGRSAEYLIVESSILSPAMAMQYPEIKTYRGTGVENPLSTIYVDLNSFGLHAMVLNAGRTVLIDPYTKGDTQTHISYEPNGGSPLQCNFGDIAKESEPLAQLKRRATPAAVSAAASAPDYTLPTTLNQLRVYRTALMLTTTYVASYDGTSAGAVSAATTQMNRVSAIYERDLNIRLQVSGTVVFTTAASQPFPVTDETDAGKILSNAQTVLTDKLGAGAFDVGEGFTGGGGGGVALLGGVCANDIKGAGSSLGVAGVTPIHWINLVAHEFGHQFGANHTFNASGVAGCKPGNINAGTAFEPGSGSTTMSYVGLCTSDTSIQDLQPVEDLIFHAYSIKEMLDYVNASAKPAATCAAPAAAGAKPNAPPVVTVSGTTYTIPAKTPFYLDAQATDPNPTDQGNLTYSWEQLNIGAPNPTNEDDGTRPLFRSYLPVKTGRRFFPSLQWVLTAANNPPDLYSANSNGGGEGAGETKMFRVGEVLPVTDRTMRFRVTVRDNHKTDASSGGSVAFADVSVRTVPTAGPFVVTSPNGGEKWTGGTTQTVTWNVAGTTASPIAATTVRISLSTDSGKTYAEILADNVPNTGSASVTLPGSASTTARVRVEAVGNIFYDVSDADFSIAAGDPSAVLISAVVNGASFLPTLAPNTFFSLFGTNIGTKETVASGLAATAGGASVTVCGTAAMLTSNSGAGSINGLIPAAAAGKSSCPVVVTVGGKSSPAFTVAISAQALGVFQFASGTSVLPVATHANNTVVGPAAGGLFPAASGETLVLWCTGWNPGAPNPAITIGGLNAPIAYYGPSGGVTGLCQINMVVPDGLGSGANSMTIGDIGPYPLWIK